MSNILIADTHNLCREALCSYIRHADQTVTVEGFGDYESVRNYVAGSRADLLLIDRDMKGWDEGHIDGIKIGVIVASADEQTMMNPALHGVFPKSLSCKAFLGGIHEILAGRTFFPSMGDNSFAYNLAPTIKPLPQDFGLTVREKEVLSYLVKGQSNKDIARALDLQVVTIKLHVRGICRKMMVSNRTQAALAAKENGWG